MGLEGPVEGSMRDTQPLCRELIGRCGHGALAPFVTREHECRQMEGGDTNDRRGKSARMERQGKPMQNRYKRAISKGRKVCRGPTPFARACRFLRTIPTRHARDTKFHIDADCYWSQKGCDPRRFTHKRGRRCWK